MKKYIIVSIIVAVLFVGGSIGITKAVTSTSATANSISKAKTLSTAKFIDDMSTFLFLETKTNFPKTQEEYKKLVETQFWFIANKQDVPITAYPSDSSWYEACGSNTTVTPPRYYYRECRVHQGSAFASCTSCAMQNVPIPSAI
jgi:hypothetical protein